MSRVVLVTGGSRGIGRAIASAFAADGDRVVVTSRSGEPGEPLPAGVRCIACDVTDTDSVEQAFAAVEADLGPVEVLVANAGVTADGLAIRMSDEAFTSVLDTNLTGAFRVARRASVKMIRARQGRIVFVSSVVGATGQKGQANYAAAKAGLVGLARSLARELAARNVTVNVVAPGPIATAMWDAVDDDHQRLVEAAIPLGRVGLPDDVAAAISFLASDRAAYITGAVLPVDGGLAMGVC